MIGKNKASQQISESRRNRITAQIGEIGRTDFANYIGENYFNLSRKLIGKARLSEVYAYYYEGKIKEMRGDKK